LTVATAASVLHRYNTTASRVAFHNVPADDPTNQTRVWMFNIGRSDWEAMRSPDQITVTVQPGDLLNPEET
jgi:hypothetical protein